MPETFFGLPLHPLIVHATVVFVPLAALSVLAAAFLPRFRAWAGPVPLILSVAALILTPLSTSTGESLEHLVGETNLVEEHAELGEMLIWWTVGLAIVSAAAYFLRRSGREVGKGVGLGLLVASVIVSSGALVMVGLIGHSGAKSAWSDTANNAQVDRGDDDDD